MISSQKGGWGQNEKEKKYEEKWKQSIKPQRGLPGN